MKRLTETRVTADGIRQFRRIGDEHWLTFGAPEVKASPMMTAIQRLAEYEDEEERGQLVRLPCKVGDTVYVLQGGNQRIGTNKVREVEVRKLELDQYDFRFTMYSVIGGYLRMNVTSCGKSYFLTRAEAEATLQARGTAT